MYLVGKQMTRDTSSYASLFGFFSLSRRMRVLAARTFRLKKNEAQCLGHCAEVGLQLKSFESKHYVLDFDTYLVKT
jgi:hypothetical protein